MGVEITAPFGDLFGERSDAVNDGPEALLIEAAE
jgi:hypothetical protein